MSERALLAGGSGLIGSALLQELLQAGMEVILPLRKPEDWRASHPQLAACAGLQVVAFDQLFTRQQPLTLFFCALGTTRAQAGKDGLYAVDYQLVVDCARYAREQGAQLASVVSAVGASPASPFLYNRIKGDMEAAVGDMGFVRTHIWRPSVLLGKRPSERPAEQVAGWFLQSPIWGNYQALPGDMIARAMLKAALHEHRHGRLVFPVSAIRRFASL